MTDATSRHHAQEALAAAVLAPLGAINRAVNEAIGRAIPQRPEGHTMTTLAYQGTESKQSVLDRLAQHRAADQIVQGTYWEGKGQGNGCAVGCLTHAKEGGHDQFPARWGVPVNIAYLIDAIFESLPVEAAVEWPTRVMSAIPEGADLSRTWDRFAAWMLHDLTTIKGVDPSVGVMADLFDRAVAGDEPTNAEWENAAWAAGAAWSAGAAGAAGAAWAAGAAGAAAGAAWAAARDAAGDAAGAAAGDAAGAAAGAAWDAARDAARAAARAAGAARAADKLVDILASSPVPIQEGNDR